MECEKCGYKVKEGEFVETDPERTNWECPKCNFCQLLNEQPSISQSDSSGGLCKKPPIGLKPKNIHDQERALEILAAMTRYVEANKTIPEAWVYELDTLYGVA
jgi:DNA-directed RNA polymerase subunit RPC12/RpoP